MKTLPAGKAYACPKCGEPMQPEKGPWDILHCYPCNDSVDLWHEPKPMIIDVPVEDNANCLKSLDIEPSEGAK